MVDGAGYSERTTPANSLRPERLDDADRGHHFIGADLNSATDNRSWNRGLSEYILRR